MCVKMFFLALAAVGVSGILCQDRTPLDDYIDRPEPEYKWEILGEYPEDGYTAYTLNMTSQVWMTEEETNQPLWWHYLIINIPDNILYTDTAFMMVDNGNMGDRIPTPEDDNRFNTARQYAFGMGVPAAILKMIPNQRLQCAGDPEDRWRREDDLIAWTWRRFADNPDDPDILLQLPMAKGAVAGMTAVTEFVNSVRPDLNPQQFFVSGGSKRAWTTYLAAAVDDRIFAIAPSVLSCLNFVEVMHHQYEAYGAWSFSNKDYHAEGLMSDIDHPDTQRMMDIVDPYTYIDRLDMPKLVISASGDEHFMPDDTWYFWNDFPGNDNYLWMLENTGHSTGNSPHRDRIPENRIEFFHSVRGDHSLPQLSWERGEGDDIGWIVLNTDTEPLNITMVWGKTASVVRRDFRMHEMPDGVNVIPQDIDWFEEGVEQLEEGVYRATMNKPDEGDGWICFFIKMTYAGPREKPLYFTTETNIIPDILPFERCSNPVECQSYLL